mgnify:CR=1 FL=1|jgi:5-(carboxyamino)imidazole ribonucleotide synthase|tara:strand:- start:1894 stop:2940 length:1047 start_codon:yes stop_codon:yes gene_type:complete
MPEQSVGILGGGQLGSLLCLAAKKLNIKTIVYCDNQDAPAQIYSDEFIFGDYKDKIKIEEFISKVDVVTYEFENIPFETLDLISQSKQVKPKPVINKIVQNRLYEKDFVNKCNISTTRYVSIKKKSDLNSNIKLIPAILKTCRLGYDGKGQYRINNINDIENLDIDFSQEYILEKIVNLKKEFSIILTRYAHSIHQIYDPIENQHENQILKYSKIPAIIDEKNILKAKDWTSIIADNLEYIGTLCVEFFIDKNDNLYVNEIAPRVHNSGHLTINAYNVSQFENHIRAICGLEKIQLKKLYNAKMINLIGDEIIPYRTKKYSDNEFFFDYEKKEIKPKRKMGHLTIIQK